MNLHFLTQDIRLPFKKTAPARTLEEATQLMAFLLRAGVSPTDMLEVLATDGARNGAASAHSLRPYFRQVWEYVAAGQTLSAALERSGHFPPFMCDMCRIGELSGNLPQVTAHLSGYYGQLARTREALVAALLYPAMVAVLMLALMAVAVLYVLPQYALAFAAAGVPLPGLTQGLLGVSHALSRPQFWLVAGLAAVGVAAGGYGLRRRNVMGTWWLYAPGIRAVYRTVLNLHVVEALCLLLQGGMPLSQALKATADVVRNKKARHDIQRVAAGLAQGQVFWESMASLPYIDGVVVRMARIGEETGDMAQALLHARDYMRHRFQLQAAGLNKAVGPLITLVLGGILAVVMLSILLPVFGMMDLY